MNLVNIILIAVPVGIAVFAVICLAVNECRLRSYKDRLKLLP